MVRVWPQDFKRTGESITISSIIESPAGRQELWYRVPAKWEFALTRQADPFAIATLLLAMKSGGGMNIHGTVSPSLLQNLEEFQAVWASWLPQRYETTSMTAERYHEGPQPQTDSAVVSFSGGLDACFSVYQHVNRLCGRRSRQIGAAVLVHGFDIPYQKDEPFKKALAAASAILISESIPVITVQTNWRSLGVSWDDGFATAISACLSLFSRNFSHGLIASGETYPNLAEYLPWGSNPLTDPMLSSAAFKISHDAGAYNRIQKAAGLLHWKTALDNLRVCWEGPMTGANCGVCEKCIRTILDFRVIGGGLPSCFPSDVSDKVIRALRIKSRAQRLNIADIVHEARRRGRGAESWVRVLEDRLREYDRRTTRKTALHRRVFRKARSLLRAMCQ